MSLVVSILGMLFILAWLAELWVSGRRGRRPPPNNLRHITGYRPWWREPPRDGPEGDH
jgi:hypothetical protein